MEPQGVLVLGARQVHQEREDQPDPQVQLEAMDLLGTPEVEVRTGYRVIRVPLEFQVKQVISVLREYLVSRDNRATRDRLVVLGRLVYLDQLGNKETEAPVAKQDHLDLRVSQDLQDLRDNLDRLALLEV